LDWDRCNQRPFIKALAEEVYPHKIICINRPADLLIGALRHKDRLTDSLSKSNLRYIKENLILFRPFYPLNDYVASWIPGFNSLQCLWLRTVLKKTGLAPAPNDRVIIWLFSFLHWPFAQLFPSHYVVYHAIDEYTLTAQGEPRPHAMRHEQQMFKVCDIVFTLSDGLAEKKSACHRSIHCLGQGVSLDHFSASRTGKGELPEELMSIPRPRLGLIGNIRDWIDFPLVAEILRRCPEWSVVFIGPKDRTAAAALESLQQYANFFWLGPKPFQELPRWLAGLDVGIIPYLQTEFTKFINPTKLYEYWAAGLPVVITSLGEMQPIEGCLWVADAATKYIDNLTAALNANTPIYQEKRKMLARQHSWENLVKRALDFLHVETSTLY
jgi:glycosyltransferase involved in cell wall biosynthesis